MASSPRRILTTLGLILVIPAACLGALLAYGRALSEAQVAEGTLLSPAESHARAEEFARRFAAMNATEHLEGARHDLNCGYDPEADLGGNFNGALHHLDAISATAPEHNAALAMRTEIARRRSGLLPAVGRRFDDVLHDDVDSDAWDQRSARIRVAGALDHFSRFGLGCVHTEASWARVLRFDHSDCDRAWLDRVVGPGRLARLRAYGFTAVRCGHGGAEIPLGAAR